MSRFWRVLVALGGLCFGVATFATVASAQQTTGINVQRDCQTVVNCNFRRGGQFRGCVSSFSCRRCRFVATKCRIGNDRRACRKLKCSWGR